MVADWGKSCLTVGLLAVCLLLGQAQPGFSRPGQPDVPLVLAAGPVKHVVKAGESINVLAQRYGVPAAAILKANPGLSPTRLQLGQEILIPTAGSGSGSSPASSSGKPPLPGIETLPPGPPESAPIKSIELRPEKAPQATPPLKERNLAEPATRPGPAKTGPSAATASPAGELPPGPEPAATPSPQAPSRPGASTETAPTAEAPGPVRSEPSARSVTASPGLLAGLGVAAVVLLGAGWLWRGLLDNLLSGLSLRLARQPRPGDVVRLDGCLGRLEALGWRTATVRTADGERLLVPNARLAREAIVVLPPQAE